VLQKVPSSFAIVADPTGAGTEKPPRVVEIEGKPVAFKYDAASGRLSATLPAAALGEGWGSGAGGGVSLPPPR